jgi:hypothetical protein
VYAYGVSEEKKPRGRPATGITPKRYLRAGPIWDEATALAEQRGETMTAFVLRAIEHEMARVRREQKRAS